MIVDNPRRALEGGSLGPADFPGLDITDVRWTATDAGERALELVGSRPLTDAEQQTAREIAESLNDTHLERLRRARAAYTANRNYLANLPTSVNDPRVLQQVERLTRIVNALLKDMARDYTSAD